MFDTIYSRMKNHTHFYSDPGSRFYKQFSLSIDKNGVKDLRPNGKPDIDIYDEIQSHSESVDIHVLLKRFENGDVSVFSRTVSNYLDTTGLPKTLAEWEQARIDGENIFNGLPVNVRAEFNHSPSEFFASIGSEKFNNIFNVGKDIVPDPEVKEVSVDES